MQTTRRGLQQLPWAGSCSWEWKLCTVEPPGREPSSVLTAGEQDGQPGCPERQDARRPRARASRLHGHRHVNLYTSRRLTTEPECARAAPADAFSVSCAAQQSLQGARGLLFSLYKCHMFT